MWVFQERSEIMRLKSKYAIILYAVLGFIFLSFGIFFYYFYSGTDQEKIGFLVVFVIVSLVMFFTSIYHVFRYIDVDGNMIVSTGFKKIDIDLNDISVIEVKPQYENTNGFYNILRTQHVKVIIKTKSKTIVFRYVGKINEPFWEELRKRVKVKLTD